MRYSFFSTSYSYSIVQPSIRTHVPFLLSCERNVYVSDHFARMHVSKKIKYDEHKGMIIIILCLCGLLAWEHVGTNQTTLFRTFAHRIDMGFTKWDGCLHCVFLRISIKACRKSFLWIMSQRLIFLLELTDLVFFFSVCKRSMQHIQNLCSCWYVVSLVLVLYNSELIW